MAGNLTILVDVDNVLENLNTVWVQGLNKKYGTDVKLGSFRGNARISRYDKKANQ